MLVRFKLALLISAVGFALAGCSILSPPRPSTTLMIALWCPDPGKEVRVLSISFLSPMVTISTSDAQMRSAHGPTSTSNLICPQQQGTLVGRAHFPYSQLNNISIQSPFHPTAVKVIYQIHEAGESKDLQGSCMMSVDKGPVILGLPAISEEGKLCGMPVDGVPLLLITTYKRYTDLLFSEKMNILCDGAPCNLLACTPFPPKISHITFTHILRANVELSFVAQAVVVRKGYEFISGVHDFAHWEAIAAGQDVSHSYTLRVPSPLIPFEAAWLTVVLPSAGGRQIFIETMPECPPPPETQPKA